jgi:predicted RNA-binding Zn ribbon-like protein
MVLADEGDAIPRHILLVRDFVNTVEWQEDADSWPSPADFGRWISERLGSSASPSSDDLALARRIREGIREVLLAHAGHEPRRWAVDDLNDALRTVPLAMAFDPAGDSGAVATTSSPHPVAPLVLALDRAARDEGWARLKACSRSSCRWAYWDASRNGTRRWCSMEGCGNYVKMRRRNGGDPAREIIPAAGEAERPPTLVDVAIRAGVSMKTVSNVVNGALHVSDGTRARVEAAITELDYRPNLAARAMAMRRSRSG